MNEQSNAEQETINKELEKEIKWNGRCIAVLFGLWVSTLFQKPIGEIISFIIERLG